MIGATNKREMLDDAILSRFGWESTLALPGAAERQNILSQEIEALGLAAEMPPEAVALTQGMSGRDIKQLARSARAIAYPDEPSREHFLQAIEAARKSRNTRVDGKASWDTLVLDSTVLDTLKLTCSLLRDAEKWKGTGVSIPRNLLLIGHPGVGKTQISRTLANESGLTFLAATTADVKANFLGQSSNRVKQIFERARSGAPSILFLDELDVIAPDRSLGGGSDPLTNEIVGQLLQEMDGIQAHDSHVFLIAATNRFEQIDPAIRSRFSEKLMIPLPDREDRIRLLSILLEGKKIDFSLTDDAVLLADLSDGKNWNGRDLENWVRAAEQTALRNALRNGGPDIRDRPERLRGKAIGLARRSKFDYNVRRFQQKGKPMRSSAVISSKGQIVIPANLRKRYSLKEGMTVLFQEDQGRLMLVPSNYDAIFALGGSLGDYPLEEDLEEERRSERDRENER